MPLPAGWKIRRELAVLYSQLLAVPEIFIGPWRQRKHDRELECRIQTHLGEQPLRKNVAILLLYQPEDLSESVLRTCAHLDSKGFSVFIVSNTPLNSNSRSRLKSLTWKIIERPNFGYDFGGYRDGILLLQRWGIILENLLLINDSIWYPIYSGDQLIDDMMQSSYSLVGPTLFGDDHSNRSRGRRTFIGSFMVLFKEDVLGSVAFRSFWRNYRLTNNKQMTMKRGERGLSKTLENAGFKMHGVLSRESFKKILHSLTLNDLVIELRELNILDPRLISMRRDLLQKYEKSHMPTSNEILQSSHTNEERQHLIKFIEGATERPNFVVTAPMFWFRRMGMGYLKKRTDLPLYRQALIDILQADEDAQERVIFSEVRTEIIVRLQSKV